MIGQAPPAAWLVSAALAATAVAVAATLVVLLLREPARRIRAIQWALAGMLIAPLLAVLPGYPRLALPDWRDGSSVVAGEPEKVDTVALPIEELAVEVERASVPIADKPNDPSEPAEHLAGAEIELPVLASVSESARSINFGMLALGVYLIGAGVMLLWSLLGLIAARRLVRRGTMAPKACYDLLAEIAGPAASRARILVSPTCNQPCVVLSLRPTIVLPEQVAASKTDELRLVLAHEWSHVARRDVWTWWLAGVVRAIHWYQPLVWWLRGQLRLSQDYLADAAAAERADNPEDYAEFLAHLTARLARPRLAAGLGIGTSKSQLHRRVVMLVNQRRPLRNNTGRAWNLIAMLATVALVGSVGALIGQEQPTQPPTYGATPAPAPATYQPGDPQHPAGATTPAPSRPPISELPTPLFARRIEPGDTLSLVIEGAEDEDPKKLRMQFPTPDSKPASNQAMVQVMVQGDGDISLGPIVGRVQIAGLIMSEAEDLIAEQLSKHMWEPQVTATFVLGIRMFDGNKPFRLGIGDGITIDAVGKETGEVYRRKLTTVEPQGVRLGPPFGYVKLDGLTMVEAEAAIAEKLKSLLTDPRVAIVTVLPSSKRHPAPYVPPVYSQAPPATPGNEYPRMPNMLAPAPAVTQYPAQPAPVAPGPGTYAPPPALPPVVAATAPDIPVIEALQPLDTIEVTLPLRPKVHKSAWPENPAAEVYAGDNMPQFSGTYVIEPDGRVVLPHNFGRVKIAGLTVEQAGTAIRNRLTERMFTRTALPRVRVTKRGWAEFPDGKKPEADYRIRKGDRLLMGVEGPDLTFNSLVNDQGELIGGPNGQGNIRVEGLTLEEAEAAVRKNWPQVTLQDRDQRQQPWFVTIGGWHEEANPEVIERIEASDDSRLERVERELSELKSLIRELKK